MISASFLWDSDPHDAMNQPWHAEPPDFAEIVARLRADGAVAVPVLRPAYRTELLAEAARHPYRRGREEIGSGDRLVRQGLDYCDELDAHGRLSALVGRVQAFLEVGFRRLPVYPFATPLQLHEPMLQHYRPGSIGITPHRDQANYINLVAVIVLGGGGQFFVCTDRQGTGLREIAAAPGDMVLLRCPGFTGAEQRVFHGVRDIAEARYSLGLRQDHHLHP